MSNREQTTKEKNTSVQTGQDNLSTPRSTGHPTQVLQRAYADPGSLSPSDVLTLQRSIGNRATTHLLRPLLQAKLTLGPAGDRYEQEADQVAQQVVRQMDSSPTPVHGETEQSTLQMKPLAARISTLQRSSILQKRTFVRKPTATIQRLGDEEEELAQMKPLHGAEGGEVEASVEQQIQQAQGGGHALDANIRRSMEGAFGADFSGVRVHTDAKADTLNRSLNARAFTTGNNLFFRRGEYNPGSSGGKQLLAHELTHVVQQGGSGPATAQAKIQRKSDKLGTKKHYTDQAKGGFKWGKATGYDKILNAIGAYHSLGPDNYMGQLQQLAKIGLLLIDWEISHGLADTSVGSKNAKERGRRNVLATLKSTDLPLEIQDVYGQAKTNGDQPDIHLLMQLMDVTQGNPGARGQIEADYAAALRSYQSGTGDAQKAMELLGGDGSTFFKGAGDTSLDNKLRSVRGLDDDPSDGRIDTGTLDTPIRQQDSELMQHLKKERRKLRGLIPALGNMSDVEIMSISAYTDEGGYGPMNEVLRGGSVVQGNNKKQRQQNAKKRAEIQQANLMAASALNKLPDWDGSPVYRGENISWLGTPTQGQTVVLKSFTSTAANDRVPKGFAMKGSATTSAVWEISGVTSQGKDISKLSLLQQEAMIGTGINQGAQEDEVLLKPYTRLRIDRVTDGVGYKYHIEATAL